MGEWRLRTLPRENMIEGPAPSLLLAEDGRVSGSTGCNQFFGAYSIENDRLIIVDADVTLLACGGPSASPNAMAAQERVFLRVLMGSPRLSLESDALVLRSDEEGDLSFSRP